MKPKQKVRDDAKKGVKENTFPGNSLDWWEYEFEWIEMELSKSPLPHQQKSTLADLI